MDIESLTDEQVIALIDDDATDEAIVEQLAEHFFTFPGPRAESVDEPMSIGELAHSMDIDPAGLVLHTKRARLDGLATFHHSTEPELGALSTDTVLDPRAATILRDTFDDIPNFSEADVGAFGAFNRRAWRKRLRLFDQRRDDPSFDGVTLVAEGDSWFQHPFPGRDDVIDGLNAHSHKYAIRCESLGGDWLAEMHRGLDATLDLVEEVQAGAFLLSGGGNDLVGEPGIGYVFRKYRPGKPASYFLGSSMERRLGQIQALYEDIVQRFTARFPDTPMLVHGYAYVFPGANTSVTSGWKRWIASSLEEVGFPSHDRLQRRMLRLALGRFNDMLDVLAEAHENVHYVDCRPLITRKNHWLDELHPTDGRWNAVAKAFDAKLDEVLP